MSPREIKLVSEHVIDSCNAGQKEIHHRSADHLLGLEDLYIYEKLWPSGTLPPVIQTRFFARTSYRGDERPPYELSDDEVFLLALWLNQQEIIDVDLPSREIGQDLVEVVRKLKPDDPYISTYNFGSVHRGSSHVLVINLELSPELVGYLDKLTTDNRPVEDVLRMNISKKLEATGFDFPF